MNRIAICCALVLALLVASRSTVIAIPDFSPWEMAANVGAVINSTFEDAGPSLSRDGRSLYFHSNRPGGFGDTDIWVSHRASVDDPWGAPMNVGDAINTTFAETVPAFSRDGHWMFFASTQPGGVGGNDIWVSWREHTSDDFGWQAPVNLGPDVNTSFFDAGPAFIDGEGIYPPTLFFASNRATGLNAATDIYASDLRSDGSFAPASYIPELSSPMNEARPTITRDGLEIILFSSREGSFGANDLWVSTRDTRGSAWAIPENLGPLVNSAGEERQPNLSSDRRTLLFASARPGGFGNFDLYVTVRSRSRP